MKTFYITETQLEFLKQHLLSEQSVIGAPNYGMVNQPPTKQKTIKGFDCVPLLFRPAVSELKSKNYNPLFLKTALGVIGRESNFGSSDRYSYLNPLKSLWGYVGGQTSIGYGQIKPETAKEFGLDVTDLNTAVGALKGVYSILVKNYNLARSIGYNAEPTSNFKEGTGNAALDMAIAAFNAGTQKIVKYCQTNDPNVKRDCKYAGQLVEQGFGGTINIVEEIPYNTPTPQPNKKYTVTDKLVQNYLPNFKTKRWDGVNISTHGYIKEVANNIKKFSCF
jgi:hypothetical protein